MYVRAKVTFCFMSVLLVRVTPDITGSKKWGGWSAAEAAPLFAVRVHVIVMCF
jgi:hypothetical protein